MSAAHRTARVRLLYRYPVKGLTPEEVSETTLCAGEGIPGDRIFAVARPDTMFDEDDPEVFPKTRFVMLQKDEALARIRSSFDPETGVLTFCLREVPAADGGTDPADPPGARPGARPGGAGGDDGDDGDGWAGGDGSEWSPAPIAPPGTHPLDGEPHRVDLASAAGRAELEQTVVDLLGPRLGGRPRLVEARGGHRFTDAGGAGPELMRAVSVVNLASVRDLADRIGDPVDPLRFRANIYIDGIRPWAELTWTGLEIGLGAARARVLARTPRCAATTVNPDTGIRDIRVLKELSSNYGHTDCGVYVTVLSGATLRPGDPLRPPAGREEDVLCGS